MEYYPITVSDFLRKNSAVSLSTRFYILQGIASGIVFLNKNKIHHNDLKLGNLVMDKNLLVKIIDFAEARSSESTDPVDKPACTIPYVSPEQLQDPIIFNEKMDIFAFGGMLSKIMFDEMIFDFNETFHAKTEEEKKDKIIKRYVVMEPTITEGQQNCKIIEGAQEPATEVNEKQQINPKSILERIKNGTYKTKNSDKNAGFVGPKHLIKLLRIVMLFCIELKPEDRLNAFAISEILMKAAKYVEMMY
jgi:serine/threonine protein kinase